KTENVSGGAYVGYEFWAGSSRVINSAIGNTTGSTGYVKQEVSVTAPSGADKLRIKLCTKPGSGYAYFDDTYVSDPFYTPSEDTPTPPPTLVPTHTPTPTPTQLCASGVFILKGYVTDNASSDPIAGAVILIDDSGVNGTTDADGFYEIVWPNDCDPGASVQVTANASGYKSQLKSVGVSVTSSSRLDFSLISDVAPSVPYDIVGVDAGNAPHIADVTIDGDYATRWSVMGDGVWIEYDLGSSKQVTSVSIQWFKGDQRIFYFDIKASTDGNTFNEVFSGESSGTTVDFEEYTVSATAQYIQIVGHGNSVDADPWTSISEVEISGSGGTSATPTPTSTTGIPTFTPTSISTPTPTPTGVPTEPGTDPVKLSGTIFGSGDAYSAGREYTKVFDGDIHTYFDCADASSGYAGIELASEASLASIRFHPRIDPRDWSTRMVGGRFQVSMNGSDYSDVHTIIELPSAGWNEINFVDSVSCKYIRYIGPTDGYCNVAEIEFYGVVGTPGPTSPPTEPPTTTETPIPTETPSSEIIQFSINSAIASKNPNDAPLTIDNDYATRWVVMGNPVYIQYDLGAVKPVTEVHVQWYRGDQRAFFFDISLSENGSDYTLVFDNLSSGSTTAFEKYEAVGNARYVRIGGYGNTVDADPWTAISDVKVFGVGNGTPIPTLIPTATPKPTNTSAVTSTPTPVASGVAWPLKYSANRRYFVDQNGKPFYIISDTAWCFIKATRADIDLLVNNRASKGFTAIQMMYWKSYNTTPDGYTAFYNNDLAQPVCEDHRTR
ncbi:discoidin domain-containing protein, partial [Spirochaetota bacterium]